MNKESVVFTKDSFRRLLNADSIPQPPSGREHMKDAPLPPKLWSFPDRNIIVSLTVPNQKGCWDKDLLDYTQPGTPPEPSGENWLEQWKSWKLEHDAAFYESPDNDPVLVHLGKRKASQFDINFQDSVGRTGLSFAAQSGDIETIERLLSMGADIELPDQDGQTPLIWAAYNGHEATVRLLLELGARVGAADNSRRTPLSWAVGRDHESVVRLLLGQGAEFDAVDNSRRTPLLWAAEGGSDVMARIVVEKGRHVNIEALDPEDQQTPLSLAAEKAHEKVVRVLLANGANPSAVDSQGLTPLSWATDNGHDEVAQLLRSFGAQSRPLS
ncbi:Ankyrin repeat-containing domain protein [Metarhizium guizhouense ARSEF 977]|uniref:Ankyrin repeat-containing domain protein n=1 Tax=Metarhizium guizhouense (strain ARSEF 977) TaxID=1276136 RepID=A0A0B4GE97_METGA|nr:Ankyrin repeat-containing domain protein [Metarhizium guizhouense ARSEF 977]